jgi:hypothetical protein
MTPWSATDITLLSGALIGGVSSLILVIQRSTCTKVKCCGAECTRVVRSLDELEAHPGGILPPDISIPPDLPIRQSALESSLSPSSVRQRVDDLERRSSPSRLSEADGRRSSWWWYFDFDFGWWWWWVGVPDTLDGLAAVLGQCLYYETDGNGEAENDGRNHDGLNKM